MKRLKFVQSIATAHNGYAAGKTYDVEDVFAAEALDKGFAVVDPAKETGDAAKSAVKADAKISVEKGDKLKSKKV